MTVKNPGRPKKGEERKEKVKKVTVVLDDEVEAALKTLVEVAKEEHVGFRAKKSAVVRKAILEAAGRAAAKKSGFDLEVPPDDPDSDHRRRGDL